MSQNSIIIKLPAWVDSFVDWDKVYTTDQEKMTVAIALSRKNVEEQTGGPFGAALFDKISGKLLSVGVNRVTATNNSTLHAEMIALMMAEKNLHSYSLASKESPKELFSSCEPCAMCLGAVLWSGVKRLVCAATGEDARAIGFDEGPVFDASYDYLQDAGIEVLKKCRRDEARDVLQNYLKSGAQIYNSTCD